MRCTVATFLDSIVANPSFTEIVAPNLKKLGRGCQIIPQIEINYNYTEVKPFGVCFSIAYKRFILNPVPEEIIRKVTPRAYASYKYDPRHVPNPKPFVDSINNSFPDAAVKKNFLRKYYQLLLHQGFTLQQTKYIILVLVLGLMLKP